jgi:hypothetical protein
MNETYDVNDPTNLLAPGIFPKLYSHFFFFFSIGRKGQGRYNDFEGKTFVEK